MFCTYRPDASSRSPVYQALYEPRGEVIVHPYNADYADLVVMPTRR
jgi:hypothetical protein